VVPVRKITDPDAGRLGGLDVPPPARHAAARFTGSGVAIGSGLAGILAAIDLLARADPRLVHPSMLWALAGGAATLAAGLGLYLAAQALLVIFALARVNRPGFERTVFLLKLLPRVAAFRSAVRSGLPPDDILPLGETPPLERNHRCDRRSAARRASTLRSR
jgi:hypothetical protein